MPTIAWSGGGLASPIMEMDKTRKTFFDPGNGGGTGTVKLECAQSIAKAALEDIIGNTRLWPYPTPVPLYAVSGGEEIESGAGTINGEGIDYDKSVLTINYITALASAGENPTYYSESMGVTSYVGPPQPAGQFTWTSGSSTPIDAELAPPKFIFMAEYILTLYNQTTPPSYALINRVNSGSFTSTTFGTIAAETLLYNAPGFDRTVSLGGSNRYTTTHRWVYNPDGHNKFWNPATGTFDTLYKIGTATQYRNYPTASFPAIP